MESETILVLSLIVSVTTIIVSLGLTRSALLGVLASIEVRDKTEDLLAKSVPPAALEIINKFANTVLPLIEFVEDVTDLDDNVEAEEGFG